MPAAFAELASGRHDATVAALGARFNLPPDELQQAALRIACSGAQVPGLPPGAGKAALVQHFVQAAAAAQAAGGAAASTPGPAAADARQGDGGEGGGGEEGPFPLEGEDRQSWLELYRRAYLVHADAAYPPALVAAAALLFWAGVLPAWVALFLLPALFLAGVHVVLVLGARLRRGCGGFAPCICLHQHSLPLCPCVGAPASAQPGACRHCCPCSRRRAHPAARDALHAAGGLHGGQH